MTSSGGSECTRGKQKKTSRASNAFKNASLPHPLPPEPSIKSLAPFLLALHVQ